MIRPSADGVFSLRSLIALLSSSMDKRNLGIIVLFKPLLLFRKEATLPCTYFEKISL